MAEPHGLDPAGVVEAVADGVVAAERDTGVRAQIIGIMSRITSYNVCYTKLLRELVLRRLWQ